jgi:hypothetical protein
MERVELTDGHVEIHQAQNAEGVGYELTFEVAKGSAIDSELAQCFSRGELLSLPHAGEDLSVSIATMIDREGMFRRYEGTAGFLRPGMGGAGG